ncbi:DUF2931 family protein [Celerinatantimonas diazotrophica]|uniref:DUF2931 family protein n=1 Tax=Celerinatantimonas diazotrophica TaxID=412034 RepID=A0A4R1K727_9GAMM|nr:DUF2931 family protein [Celerinatantimonas diazotrophica]TCK60078.1 DUF2931 family protein [Celerinatantimonas diazotrophica]CAG9295109.1 hypothetical protein CEDIAZO_00221 [Celerinatantimonas diazotrophica]
MNTQRIKSIVIQITLFVALVPLVACQAQPEHTSDRDRWLIGYVAPSIYPVEINEMNAMDKNGEPMAAIRTQIQAVGEKIQSVRRTFPHYDGYALPLSVFTTQETGQMGMGTTELPDYFEINWTSLVNLKRYQTRVNVTKQIRDIINQGTLSAPVDRPSEQEECHYFVFNFGFLPDGRVKVWLGGCGPFKYIETLQSYKVYGMDGFGLGNKEFIKEYQPKLIKYTQKQGYPDPRNIPWEKVNKVLHREYDIQHKQWQVIEGTH